jgi:hypothetical protein
MTLADHAHQAALFDEADVPARPSGCDLTLLDEFETWATKGNGATYWEYFDPYCLRMSQRFDHYGLWVAVKHAEMLCGVSFTHTFVPLLSRLWMIQRNRWGFFKTTELKHFTEAEVEAVCRRILAAWKEAA